MRILRPPSSTLVRPWLARGVVRYVGDIVLPGMVFDMLYNGGLLLVALLPKLGYMDEGVPLQTLFHPLVTGLFTLLALAFLTLLARHIAVAARKARLEAPPP